MAQPTRTPTSIVVMSAQLFYILTSIVTTLVVLYSMNNLQPIGQIAILSSSQKLAAF